MPTHTHNDFFLIMYSLSPLEGIFCWGDGYGTEMMNDISREGDGVAIACEALSRRPLLNVNS